MLSERLAQVLRASELEPLVGGARFSFSHALRASFVLCEGSDEIVLGPAAQSSLESLRRAVHHALELRVFLDLAPSDRALAGLMAARCAVLHDEAYDGRSTLEGDATSLRLSSSTPPSRDEAEAVWRSIRGHQTDAPSEVTPATANTLSALWPLVGPTHVLLATGGDARLRRDPVTGLNAHGCSPRPRPWAVTFASSTASSISERGYRAAERARRHLLRDAVAHGRARAEHEGSARVKAALRAHYALRDDVAVILTPSGTDGELCALALSRLGAPSCPHTNVLIAPAETGTGVPLAAAGRHFGASTARGIAVEAGRGVAGLASMAPLVTIDARESSGAARSNAAVVADCARALDAARSAHGRALLHVLDQSKTGLVIPDVNHGLASIDLDEVDVLVDACQTRLSTATVHAYLDHGWMVLVTGSKFFTGPPFAGALLVPQAIARRLAGSALLPSGLRDYVGAFDWPDDAAACAELAREANVGVVLRWEAALAEMEAFARVDESTVCDLFERFGETVRAAIAASDDFGACPTSTLARPAGAPRWEHIATVHPFLVRAPHTPSAWLELEDARRLCEWLNADVSSCLDADASAADRTLAARLLHIGQPVETRVDGRPAAALRICAGARLASGEPSQEHLAFDARVARELSDAAAVFAKIALLRRCWDALARNRPRARYQ
ncbi:MAG: hypothetical protein ACHREM_21100 [Polyangiales bacterium]